MSAVNIVTNGLEALTKEQAIDISFIKSTGEKPGIQFTIVKKANGAGYEGDLLTLVNQYSMLDQSEKRTVASNISNSNVSFNGPDCPD